LMIEWLKSVKFIELFRWVHLALYALLGDVNRHSNGIVIVWECCAFCWH
jgi:hypothetical protein